MEILTLLKNRDERGLSLLYDNYAPTLLGLIMNILGNREVAEEVLQQTMLKIWDNIHSYDVSKSGLYTWMATIARNTAIDKRRLKSFQNNQQTNSIDTEIYHLHTVQTSTSAIDIEKLTADLNDNQKQVLDMVYLKGYTHKETAKVLDIPLGTVKSRLRLAIKALKEDVSNERKLMFGLLILSLIILLITIS